MKPALNLAAAHRELLERIMRGRMRAWRRDMKSRDPVVRAAARR
jgi:hypothetical protein